MSRFLFFPLPVRVGLSPGLLASGPHTCLAPTMQPTSLPSEWLPHAPTPQSLLSPAPVTSSPFPAGGELSHHTTRLFCWPLPWPGLTFHPQCPCDCGVLGAAEGVRALVPVTSRQAPGRTAPRGAADRLYLCGWVLLQPPESERARETQPGPGTRSASPAVGRSRSADFLCGVLSPVSFMPQRSPLLKNSNNLTIFLEN